MYLPESQQMNLSASDLVLAMITTLVIFPVIYQAWFMFFGAAGLGMVCYLGITGRCIALVDNYVLFSSGSILSTKKLHYLLQTIGLVMSVVYFIPYVTSKYETITRDIYMVLFVFFAIVGEITFCISSFLAYKIICNAKEKNNAQVNMIYGANPNASYMSDPQLHTQPKVQLQVQAPSYVTYGQRVVP